MTEVRPDTEQQQDSDPKKPSIDPTEVTPELFAQFQAFLAQQAAQSEGTDAVTPETPTQESTPTSEVTLTETQTHTEAPEKDQGKGFSRKAIALTLSIVAGVAATVWGATAFANRSSSGPIATASAPANPTPAPTTTETQQPTPSETATTPEGTSQMEMAQELLGSENAEFNAMPLSLRQRAVDGRYNDIVSAFTDETLSYPYIAGMSPYTEGVGKFAAPEGKDLFDFNPVNIASLVNGGEAPDNAQASAQDILNQLTFARAAAWGQVETPMTRQLDQNTAANMVSGYFYDPKSRGAQDMIAELERSKTIKIFGPESYTKPDHVTNSSVLRTHTFDGLGNLPYKVINYNLGDGKLYKIVTPVTTEFTGPDPRGVKGDIVTLSITKWLVLQEGTGTEDINGRLKHIS